MKVLPLVAIYESQVIPKGIKTNYFTPTKIHIQYKTIKIYKKNYQKLSIINITFKHNHQNQSSKTIIKLSNTIIIDNQKLNQNNHKKQSLKTIIKDNQNSIKNNHRKLNQKLTITDKNNQK